MNDLKSGKDGETLVNKTTCHILVNKRIVIYVLLILADAACICKINFTNTVVLLMKSCILLMELANVWSCVGERPSSYLKAHKHATLIKLAYISRHQQAQEEKCARKRNLTFSRHAVYDNMAKKKPKLDKACYHFVLLHFRLKKI